jgi:L-aminopeptidase/D-esterase-like protein
VLLPDGTTGSVEVRGGAPATRELDALAPERIVTRVDAVLLTGGSAFGLAAADGVMRWCEEHGVGFPTPAGVVPIVPTLGLYDLAVGAGTGATVGNWRGPTAVQPGGLGSATVRRGELVVSALVAVNAYGEIDPDGTATGDPFLGEPVPIYGNTTIGVVATNAGLDKLGCLIVAQGAHDGLARSVVPAHTRADGDAFVAVATGRVEAVVDVVRLAAVTAVERAVRSV